jgi:DivIVA domain-containing protein
MSLKPQDIVQKEFREAFRGYNQADVDLFLDQVTQEITRLTDENERLRSRLDALQRELDRGGSVEGKGETSSRAVDDLRRMEEEIRGRLRSLLEEQLATLDAVEGALSPPAPRRGSGRSGTSTRGRSSTRSEPAREFWERE